MVRTRTTFIRLDPRLSLPKTLHSFSSLFRVQDCHHFFKTATFLIVLVKSRYSSFYNRKIRQKTVSLVGQRYSASAPVCPCTIITIFGFSWPHLVLLGTTDS